MDQRFTPWHAVAFLGELVLWACAGWAGWLLGGSTIVRVLLATAMVVAVIVAWSVWAAPRSARRLALGPRLGFIGVIGTLVASLHLLAAHPLGVAVTLVATLAVVVAQWADEPSGARAD